MKTAAIKQEMHHAIDIIDDSSFLKAIYTILNDKSKEYEFTNEEKSVISDRLEKYEKRESKLYTWQEVKTAVKKNKK